jgi:lysyl-tRNA synthetase class 2
MEPDNREQGPILSDKKKAKNNTPQPVKLKTRSPAVEKFQPLLQNLAATGELNEVLKNRIEKTVALVDQGVPLFPNTYGKNTDVAHIIEEYSGYTGEELEAMDRVYTLAGRIVALRSFGKAAFMHIQDATGRIQVFIQKSEVDQETFAVFKKLDIGDIVSVTGSLFRTRTEELTLKAADVRLASKSLRPLPEKYHGLKDVETRYRQRYVDLIVNPRARDIFKARNAVVREMRNFLDQAGFLEVETPMMQPIPGGATARPFITHHNTLDMKLYMRIAPELYLKRLLVGGFEKVYEINRNFRNEGISTQHNPEFTMCEFYWAFADYKALMDFTEDMFAHIARAVTGDTRITYQGQEVDLTPGAWTRISFHDSLENIGGLAPEEFRDIDKAKAVVKARGEKVLETEKLGKVQEKLFDIFVEPRLIQPHFIHGYPTDISPLSRRNEDDPEITDRFELFIAAREMANAFSELNDPLDQRSRFEDQAASKLEGDEEAHFMDEDYLRALEYGMPPAAGEGVGIDRLVMLLTDSQSIREVILFPLLRQEAGQS